MRLLKIFGIVFLGLFFAKCSEQQARKPISQSSGTFIKESIERNKKLNENEEQIIQDFIENDSTTNYLASTKGYWYTYINQIKEESYKPVRGDFAYFDYEIQDLKGNIIYTKEELKPQKYLVDKENIMSGLREGIKIMKKGEKITFLFPSHIAFGYHGDNNKIGTNTPLLCTVSLTNIEKQD